jgi:RNA polymerase sigma-70 factor (ECF subfamily)
VGFPGSAPRDYLRRVYAPRWQLGALASGDLDRIPRRPKRLSFSVRVDHTQFVASGSCIFFISPVDFAVFSRRTAERTGESRSGDEMNPTVESIWNEFSTRLDQFIRARVTEPATAEDLLQDVFLKLQTHLDEFHDPMKLQGWLFLVARNAIIDHYRTRKKTSELPESLYDELSENQTEEKELKAVFRRLLYSLPQPYRDALVLTEFEGLTQEKLSRHLSISLSGAKSRVQRGRELLKVSLLDYCHREFSRAVGSQPCPKGLLPIMQDVQKGMAGTPRTRAKSRKNRHVLK